MGTVSHLHFPPPDPPLPPVAAAPPQQVWTADEVAWIALDAAQNGRLEARAECARLHGHGLRAVPSS